MTDLGYDPRNLASVNLVMREGAHDQWADRVHYYEQIREAIAADPNVLSAAIGAFFRLEISSPRLSVCRDRRMHPA